jgi:hypothetical protein
MYWISLDWKVFNGFLLQQVKFFCPSVPKGLKREHLNLLKMVPVKVLGVDVD